MTATALPIDPRAIDWPARQASAHVRFSIIDGLPVNPVEPDLPDGQGELYHWGERPCADTAVFVIVDNVRWLLLGRRDDGHGWALPGGGLKDDETALAGGLRELHEEAGLLIDPANSDITIAVEDARYVPDPRAARNSWMVTSLIVIDLKVRAKFPRARAGSDLNRVAWFLARTPTLLESSVRHADPGGRLFGAHRQILADLLTNQPGQLTRSVP